MLGTYLKIAFRNLWKNRMFTLINVTSLSLCLTGVLALLLVVSKLINFDDFHEHGDRLFIVNQGDKSRAPSSGVAFPALDQLKRDFPEVEAGTRSLQWDSYLFSEGHNSWSIVPEFVDADFLKVFTYPLNYGDASVALADKNSIILSEQLALRMFGERNPVGKTLQMGDSSLVTISGVLEKIPGASSFNFEALMPMQWLYESGSGLKEAGNWENAFTPTYILLREGVSKASFEAKLPSFVQAHFSNLEMQHRMNLSQYRDLIRIYVPQYSQYVIGLQLIVFFLLVIATVNLINLTVATAMGRAREVGVRKVLGSSKAQINRQFLVESSLLIGSSMLIGMSLLQPVIAYFNSQLGAEFTVDFIWRQDHPMVMLVCLIFLLLALLSAWYPSSFLNRLKPSLAIKGNLQASKSGGLIQRSLIVVQFSLAVIFIFSTLVINQQMQYLKGADLGFTKDHVLVVDMSMGYKDSEKAYQSIDAIMQQLKSFPEVQSITASRSIPGNYPNWYNVYEADAPALKEVRLRHVSNTDENYFSTYNIGFLAGEPFYSEKAATHQNAVILNKSAALAYGWKPAEAIGKAIKAQGSDEAPYTIIGVTEDFHYRGLNETIEPLAHFSGGRLHAAGNQFMSISVSPSEASRVIDYMQKEWAKIPSTGSFSYSYVNESFNKQYERENMLMTLVGVASAVAIIVACAGTFGLVVQMARSRIKEIGVRKVLGASVLHILALVSLRFLLLVLIALMIAIPIAYAGIHIWLQSFAYRIDISAEAFVITAAITLLVTSLTVGIQALKTALANPVDSLRDE